MGKKGRGNWSWFWGNYLCLEETTSILFKVYSIKKNKRKLKFTNTVNRNINPFSSDHVFGVYSEPIEIAWR